MSPTLGVADEMYPLRGLCHDGDHSLSEPLHLFPQGPQALSAIEEIKYCHHSPGVCLWEGGNATTGDGLWSSHTHPLVTIHMPTMTARTRDPSSQLPPHTYTLLWQFPEELAVPEVAFSCPLFLPAM